MPALLIVSDKKVPTDYDIISDIVEMPQGDHLGFCPGYQLRRPKMAAEKEANQGSHQARRDWHRLIGPIDTFANTNPYQGNFASICAPFMLAERAALVSYLFECMRPTMPYSPQLKCSLLVLRCVPVRRHTRVRQQGASC